MVCLGRASADAGQSLGRRKRQACLILFALAVGLLMLKHIPGVSVRDSSVSRDLSEPQRRLADTNDNNAASNKPLRILYIITSLAEYNSGLRATQRGSDRLQETIIPVMSEGVKSMLSFGYHVDVHLVCHWTMQPERLDLIRQALPSSVGLEYWDDATPIGYVVDGRDLNHTDHLTRSLARQHRFVIKDKFSEYDFFMAFEDDMLVKADQVKHFLQMSQELARLRQLAPDETLYPRGKKSQDMFYGTLTKSQLARLIPGIMRVEALLDEDKFGTQTKLAPVPVDLVFDGVNRTVDPKPCCHVSNETANNHIPLDPPSNKLFIWETGIEGLSVREIPSLGWVMFLGGTSGFKAKLPIGDYWSGRDGEFGDLKRPRGMTLQYLSNQGGWMATRQQIWEWHTEICPGGFLPPFYAPHYRLDGVDARNVEYWSGGLNLFTARHACNMQRIVSLDPDEFSRHLVYHTANNKQTQLALLGKRDRFVKVDHLLGQLNTVRKRAEKAKRNEATKR